MEPSKRPRLVTRKHPDDDPGADFMAHLGEQVSHLRDAVEDLAREHRAVRTEPAPVESGSVPIPKSWLWGLFVMLLIYLFGLPAAMTLYHNDNTPAPTSILKDSEHDRRLDEISNALREFRAATEARFRENEATINRRDP